MSIPTEVQPTEAEKQVVETASDGSELLHQRCDGCGHRVQTMFVREDPHALTGGPVHDDVFFFCKHHADKHEDALREAGYQIRSDFRTDLR